MREDGGTDMAAGAISAEAAGPSLDSTEFCWVGAAWKDVQILEVEKRVETEGESLFNLSVTPLREPSHELFLLAVIVFTSAAFKSAQVPLIKACRKW